MTNAQKRVLLEMFDPLIKADAFTDSEISILVSIFNKAIDRLEQQTHQNGNDGEAGKN